MFRPFDIVKFKTAYGMVTTTRENVASVVWFDDDNRPVKNAWWNESELTVCGNFIEIIANAMDCNYGHIDKRFLQGSMFINTKGLEVKEEEIQRITKENYEIRQELRNAKATIEKQEEYIKTLL